MAARAVYREFSIYKNTAKRCVFGFLDFGDHFRFVYDIPEAPEVLKNLPGTRGFVVLQYGTVASHGDHIRARNYSFLVFLATLACAVLRNHTCAVLRSHTCAVLRSHTCAVLGSHTGAVLRSHTCAVLRNWTCAVNNII